MANLELKLLGGFSLRQNGLPVPELKTQKGQALLCYLAVSGKPASRAALAGLFWPDMPEADAHMNLRKVLVRLKPLSPYLSITRATLALNPHVSPALDVAEFEAHATAQTNISRLQKAVDLFSGDFLDGFYLDNAPLFDEWVLAQRARLRALALSALDILIAHFSSQAAYATAIHYAQQVLALEPWHEETHRELMRLLALSGQRSAALVQFETCRSCLAGELDVDPAPATVHLYEQIKSGALAGLAIDAARQTMGGPAEPRHNLPVQTTSFVGRERELAALADHLADPNVRLLTILGLGGMGKTRLALAVAAAQLNALHAPRLFSHGVIFVSLARLETADQLVPAIAEAVNLRFLAGSEQKTQLLDYLRQKAMLLLLDNFEHLRAQASLVDEILRAGARIKILVTSREKLNPQAEQLFLIGGMDLPTPEQAADETANKPLSEYSAIQLFCARARRVRPDFVLTAEKQRYVLDICRLVHGMPLGIVLATAWLGAFSPAEIAAEIRANLDFLASEMEDMPERQRSLRAAFNHAWRLLPEQHRDVFLRLSIFRGGFTRAAAQTVASASLRDLQALVNKSLLAVSLDGRHEVHELLRQFASEKLAEAPEIEAAMRDRQSAYYCNFLREQSENWHTARQLETLAGVTSESDNVQRAWQWALDRGDCSRLVLAIDSWGWYHVWRGRFAEGETVFLAVVERAAFAASGEKAVSPDLYRLWAKALAWQGLFAINSLSALMTMRHSLSLFERPELAQQDTRRDRAFALKVMADTNYGLDRPTARQLVEQSLALYRACGDPWGIAIGLSGLGHLDWATGNYAQALERIQASLVMHQARGDLREQAESLSGLAWIHLHLGQLEQAMLLRREVLDICRKLGDRSALVGYMANLAHNLIWQGKFEEMRQWADNSLALCLEMGHRGSEGYVRLAICNALVFAGHYEQARLETTQTLALVKEAGDHGVEASVHWVLGCLALAESACDEAQSEFTESRRLYEEVQDNYVGLVLPGPGYVACCQRRFAQACPHFVEALQSALALKDYVHLVAALPGVALFLSLTGEIVRAVEVWELALGLPFVANSRWHADVVGQPVEAAAAAIAPDEREAARARGRALSLWETAEELVNELQQHEIVAQHPTQPETADQRGPAFHQLL